MGDHCQFCVNGSYGNATGGENGCKPCNCNDHGDVSKGICNKEICNKAPIYCPLGFDLVFKLNLLNKHFLRSVSVGFMANYVRAGDSVVTGQAK